MDDKDILKGRIHDLSSKAGKDCYLTHTSFLSLSEQAIVYQIFKDEHVSLSDRKYAGCEYFFYGGKEEEDRKVLFFLPYYLSKEEALENIQDGEIISCIHIYPKNLKFAESLSNRDFLGALMHLGVKREMYGDILTDGHEAYLFVMNSVVDLIIKELNKVRHTYVLCEMIKPKDCPFEMRFSIEEINVSSLRIDTILSETYHLSRRDGQMLIASECVFLNGMTMKDNSHILREGDRISIKGKGKFIFLNEKGVSKKGRLFVRIKRYV